MRSDNAFECTVGDRGFTRADVLTVLALLTLGVVVGVPTYTGAQARAHDKAAQASLIATLQVASELVGDAEDYALAAAGSLSSPDLDLTVLPSPVASTEPRVASVAVAEDGGSWGAAIRSETGTCFYLRASVGGSRGYDSSAVAACTGEQALHANRSAWIRPGPTVTVSDGGFESVAIDPPHGWELYAVGQTVGGWTVLPGTIGHHGATHQSLSSGDGAPGGQHLDLQGQGGIEQRITGLRADTTYTLTFSHALDPAAGGPAMATVSIADLEATFEATSTGDVGWIQVRYSFTARDSSETLTFTGIPNGRDRQGGVMIDGVGISR